MLTIASPLSEELERLAHDVIGCCLHVHRHLGPGLLEAIYAKAIGLELTANKIPFEAEKSLPVYYRETLLCHQRLDLLVAGQLVLEVKAVERLGSVHVAQILSYMHVAGVRLGLLVNFNESILKRGMRRVIL
jgi:GxxExxY protein